MTDKPTPREYAIKRLEDARRLIDEEQALAADEAILDVMDQLTHYCGNRRYHLYSLGEPQPYASRLHYALDVLATGGMALFRNRK